MSIYENYREGLNQLERDHRSIVKKYTRSSSSISGDWLNKVEDLADKIMEIKRRILKYEEDHPEEFRNEQYKLASTNNLKTRLEQRRQQDQKQQNLRPAEITNQILIRMSTSPFVRDLEEKLSEDHRYWEIEGTPLPRVAEDSYLFWFCFYQIQAYAKFSEEVKGIASHNLSSELPIVMKRIIDRNDILISLVENWQNEKMTRSLLEFSSFLRKLDWDIVSMKLDATTSVRLKNEIRKKIDRLKEILRGVGKLALDLTEEQSHLINYNKNT